MLELSDMRLFVRAMRWGSLSAAGRELGFSPAVASKRLSRLETALGVRLIQRSSRRLVLTEEGRRYLSHAQAILEDVAQAAADMASGSEASGLLRVTAPNALGRRWVGPELARFCDTHPRVDASLSLDDNVADLLEGGFDLAIRIGAADDSRLVSRRLAGNRRIVCASPEYLARCGCPVVPSDLKEHSCLLLHAAGAQTQTWRIDGGHGPRDVRVAGRLCSDNGEQIHDWALQGRGVAFKSIWDVAADIVAGRLVELLPGISGEQADVYAVFPCRRFLPARTRLFIDALVALFGAQERTLPSLAPMANANLG
ncbi:LysR family transcriptional regulator [Paludibacterium yongneupense]|uniref:LysR family transcriptional regulator n=1 Tax=Paludibacterium yongneupense TaxID=400061 RepID=UPI0003F5DC69|nr:LysR family transcriptional regulator [Paludibacterium yongneupense]